MTGANTKDVAALREQLAEVQASVDAVSSPALLQCLQEVETSGQRSREDNDGPLTQLMRRLWRVRRAAYEAEQIALRLQEIPETSESKQFQSLGRLEWVDSVLRDHAYISARVEPGKDVIMFFLATDQDGDLDLALDPDALERVITFLSEVRDRAVMQAGSVES